MGIRSPHDGGAAHDEHRRQVGYKHGQNVLQAKGDGLGQGDPPVQSVDVVFTDGFDLCFLVFHP